MRRSGILPSLDDPSIRSQGDLYSCSYSIVAMYCEVMLESGMSCSAMEALLCRDLRTNKPYCCTVVQEIGVRDPLRLAKGMRAVG